MKYLKIVVLLFLLLLLLISIFGNNHFLKNEVYTNLKIKIGEKKYKNNLIGNLEIPDLEINLPIYAIDSVQNNIDYNLQIISGSIMPNYTNSQMIIIGHSGYGPFAYFKDLDLISFGDIVNLTYENIIYTYNVKKIYYSSKKNVNIVRSNNHLRTLTLITCHPQKNNMFLFVYLEET